jgi:hypothetical protein
LAGGLNDHFVVNDDSETRQSYFILLARPNDTTQKRAQVLHLYLLICHQSTRVTNFLDVSLVFLIKSNSISPAHLDITIPLGALPEFGDYRNSQPTFDFDANFLISDREMPRQHLVRHFDDGKVDRDNRSPLCSDRNESLNIKDRRRITSFLNLRNSRLAKIPPERCLPCFFTLSTQPQLDFTPSVLIV